MSLVDRIVRQTALVIFTLSNVLYTVNASTVVLPTNPFFTYRRAPCENGVGIECELKERLASYYDPSEAFYQLPRFASESPLIIDVSNHEERGSSQATRSPSVGNSCPGYAVQNSDNDRVPNVISEWKCSCINCQLPRSLTRRGEYVCKPIYHLYQVLRREQGGENWQVRLEPISVGCRCQENVSPITGVVF